MKTSASAQEERFLEWIFASQPLNLRAKLYSSSLNAFIKNKKNKKNRIRVTKSINHNKVTNNTKTWTIFE